MKSSSLFLILLLFHFSFSQWTPTDVIVELSSGTRQVAKLVDIQKDTVHLSGKIQGKETLVRIPLQKFKSILRISDSTYIPLENWIQDTLPPPPNELTPKDSAISEESEPHIAFGHLIIASPEVKGIDSSWIPQLQLAIQQILRDGTNFPTLISDTIPLETAIAAKALGYLESQWTQDKESLSVLWKAHLNKDSTTVVSLNMLSAPIQPFATWIYSGAPWQILGKVLDVPLAFENSMPPAKASLWIETEPEGALISVNGDAPACKSPCSLSFPASPTKSQQVSIWASWQVEDHLWAKSSRVTLLAGDSTRMLLKLEPSHASIQLQSNPSDAEVFPADKPWSPKTPSLGHTPLLLEDFQPGMQRLRLMKRGFKDTIVELVPDPTSWNQYQFQLAPLLDPAQREVQESLFKDRNRLFWGNVLIGASTGPLLVGATLIWIAQNDYEKADQISEELEFPSSGKGSAFIAKQTEQENAIQNGNAKRVSGLSLVAVGMILGTIGFTLRF